MRQKKPPYRVPLMSEIVQIPWNGFTVASTFSGCGGSSLGYRMAGFKVLWANEFIPAARETYEANKAPYTILDGSDIRTVKGRAVLKLLGLKRGELDLLDGSPPCSSFSVSGKREKGWGEVRKYSDTKQRTDDLFFEFIRLLDELRPRTFVAENVAGLVRGTAKGMFIDFLKRMKAVGYNVGCRVLDAKWLGVPQSRTRTIFIGIRNDLGTDPQFPTPLPYTYSVRDALPDLAGKAMHKQGGYRITDCTSKPAPTVLASQCGMFEETSIERFAIGAEYDKLKEGEQSSKYFNLIRADRNQPSPTILASHGNLGMAGVTHPTEKRKFTIPEVIRICGFPDDFILTGTYEQQWERLGRAVPPVMMSHIARSVSEILRRAV